MSVRVVFRRLLKVFGHQGWWPTTSPGGREPRYRPGFWGNLSERERLEICLGAILTQNTSWTNVVKALSSLSHAGIKNLRALSQIPSRRLETLIHSSGYFRQKSRKLKIFADHVLDSGFSLSRWLSKPAFELRRELLGIWGIGPETADSILLYAARRPVFVVDVYTSRISRRIGWVPQAEYSRLKLFFEKNLPRSAFLYAECHALFVALAKNNCRVKPVCHACPLLDVCAYGTQVRA